MGHTFDGVGGHHGAGRWGHWAPQVLVAAVAATVALALAPLPPGNPAVVMAPALLVVVVLATWQQMRRHDRALCELCMAAMPLNPSEAARRFDRRLAVAHLGSDRRALTVYLVVLLGADLSVVTAPAGLAQAAVVAWACVQSSLIYLVLSHVTHRRLQPWCSRCGGGGGEDVGTSDPLPVDSSST